jgi:hypothetical protein
MAASRRFRWLPVFITVQLCAILAFGVAFARNANDATRRILQVEKGRLDFPPLEIPRQEPLRIAPLYDDPEMVSDDDLAAVLRKIQPRFPSHKTKPNYVEHALRAWGVDAEFRDKYAMSGLQLEDFLLNHGKYLDSWGAEIEPLLKEEETGISVRWGKVEGASVHHDHMLACLTEAGVALNQPVFTPNHHQRSINDVLQQSLRDFRVDERETEWSLLGYGLWLPPINKWKNNEGREITFDMLGERMLRGALPEGVCHGTHRIYSLMALIRLDDQFEQKLITAETRTRIMDHLRKVRDIIQKSQFADGHWPSNWPDGEAAVKKPVDDELFRKVISTGHHVEWQAIAPQELLLPKEQLHRAAKWLVATTKSQTQSDILDKYTFFSHVGNALALWRKTRPATFWKQWEAKHPEEGLNTTSPDAAVKNAKPAAATTGH